MANEDTKTLKYKLMNSGEYQTGSLVDIGFNYSIKFEKGSLF